jgi:spore coat protein A
MSPAERADVIVDFTGLAKGTELFLINEGPDGPFAGGTVVAADPNTTGQVMKFVVGDLCCKDTTVPPDQLQLPPITPLGPADVTRRLSLNEVLQNNQPVELRLGTVDGAGNPVPLGWDDPVTEHPALHATEIWEFENFSADAHPMHVHEVQFEVLGRGADGNQPPEPWERGFKDMVIAYPGQMTRVKARFDLPGRYVWHCHILEHEDNEMMRPYQVG